MIQCFLSVIPLDPSLSNPFLCSWVFCIVFLCCFLYFCQQVVGRLPYKWVINKGFHYHDSRKSPLQRYQTLGGCLFLFIILTICSSEALEWGIVIITSPILNSYSPLASQKVLKEVQNNICIHLMQLCLELHEEDYFHSILDKYFLKLEIYRKNNQQFKNCGLPCFIKSTKFLFLEIYWKNTLMFKNCVLPCF